MNTEKRAVQKKLSPLNAWAFSFACMIGWAAFVMPATYFLPNGGVKGSILAFLAAAAAMCVIALNYHYLGNLYPEVGGIYPLIKHSIGHDHAFAAGWAMGLAHLCCVPLNARALGMLVRSFLEHYLQIKFTAHVFHSNVLLVDAAVFSIALIGFGWLHIRGIKQAARTQTVGAIVLLAGIVIMLAAAYMNADDPTANFSPDYYPGTHPLHSFMTVFVMMPWAFVGFDSLSNVTRHLNFPIKRLGRIMIISVLCGTFAYLANIFITLLGMPKEYGSWPEYLTGLESVFGFSSYPVLSTSQANLGPAGVVIFAAAAGSATLTGLVGFFLSISHLVYQMAKDGALPPSLAELHPKRGTPANAIRLVVFMSFLLLILLNAFESIEELASVATAIGFGYCSVAAMVQAIRRRKPLYIVTGMLGLDLGIVWVFFLLVPVPGVSSAISEEAILGVAIWIFLGIAAYVYFRHRKPRQLHQR